mgnify:CR=1 FL=1|tara:strand:+ start:80 stop:364 length:285 start_codon:yes stop_codon:yes gene_type:complete
MNGLNFSEKNSFCDISVKRDLLIKELDLKKAMGEITFFIPDVSFFLPNGESIKFDFQIFNANGKVSFFTSASNNISREKKEQIEMAYSVEIKEF